MLKNKRTIGIKLGQTNCCVATTISGSSDTIANDFGNRVTPTAVGLIQDEIVVGEKALSSTDEFCGLDKILEMSNNGKNGNLLEILIKKLKSNADDYFGEELKDVVFSVPSSYSSDKRLQIKSAGEKLGLNVLKLTSESQAVLEAYDLMKSDTSKYYLLVKLSGTKLVVTICNVDSGIVEEKFTVSEDIGGETFVNSVFDFLADEFNRKNNNEDIRKNPKAVRRLKAACERSIKILSSSSQSLIEIDCLINSIDFSFNLTRNKFEELCLKYFSKCADSIKNCLTNYCLELKDISEVILFGGSTRIPKFKDMVKECVGKDLLMYFNPDEVVANGASMIANKLA